jgi:hypothetical protein
MEALPEAEKELEAMPNVHALFFNGTFITASGNSPRLPAWTRTCLSTCPFDPGESYPFDPGIDNSSRSLLDLASSPGSLKPSDPIDTTGWSPWTSFNETSIADSKYDVSCGNANDVVDNATCFDFKYPNAWRLPPWPDDDELGAKAEPLFPPPKTEAWFLPPWPDDDELGAKAEPLFPPPKTEAWFLPPWPDDDELSAKAEPPDERRPEPSHQLNDGQHHSDKPCNTNCDGYTLPSAKPC